MTTLSVVSAAAVGLVLWSVSWPHPDMRQAWATIATGFLAVVGLGATAYGLRLGRWAWRTVGVTLLAGAVVGAGLVYPLLHWATASAR